MALLGVALATLGCSFDRRGVAPPEGDRTASRDASVGDRASGGREVGRDGVLDRRAEAARDHAKLDQPVPVPDLPLKSCDELFKASVPSYALCDEQGDRCRFYFVSTAGTSNCTQICGSHSCLTMEDNEAGKKCVNESPMLCGSGPCTCGSNVGDGICTCKK